MKLRIALIASMLIAGLGGWLFLHSSSAAPSSTEVKLYLSPAQLSVKQGQTFSEAIRLSKTGNEKVDYVSAQLTFPAQLITIQSVNRSGSAFNNGIGIRVTYSNSSGTFSASGSGNALGSSADVLVVTITFMAKATGQANVKFSTTSQAGALLGNNTVKNALDTMVGSVINIAAASTPSSTTTKGGSGSTTKTPSTTGSNTKSEPAITTPAARPNTTSALNDAPQSSETDGVSTNTSGVTTNSGKAKQMWPWLPWLLLSGLILGLPGGVVARLVWVAKKHSLQPTTAESDNIVVTPQEAEASEERHANVDEPQATKLAEAGARNDKASQVASESKDGSSQKLTRAAEKVPSATATSTTQLATPTPARPSMSTAAETTNTASTAPINPPSATEATKPSAQAPTNLTDDNVPDMFDDGEKRLKSEGL